MWFCSTSTYLLLSDLFATNKVGNLTLLITLYICTRNSSLWLYPKGKCVEKVKAVELSFISSALFAHEIDQALFAHALEKETLAESSENRTQVLRFKREYVYCSVI